MPTRRVAEKQRRLLRIPPQPALPTRKNPPVNHPRPIIAGITSKNQPLPRNPPRGKLLMTKLGRTSRSQREKINYWLGARIFSQIGGNHRPLIPSMISSVRFPFFLRTPTKRSNGHIFFERSFKHKLSSSLLRRSRHVTALGDILTEDFIFGVLVSSCRPCPVRLTDSAW